jgi:hypothetical protein
MIATSITSLVMRNHCTITTAVPQLLLRFGAALAPLTLRLAKHRRPSFFFHLVCGVFSAIFEAMTIGSALKAMRGSAVLTVLLLILFSAIDFKAFAREKPSRAENRKKAAAASKETAADLNSDIRRELDTVPVKDSWKHIVIHHTGTATGTAKGIDRFHREERHMENGLAYHFLIGNGRGMGDGEIYIGERWKKQLPGGHLASDTLNKSSIGICLVGNFDRTRPTTKQTQSLNALITKLRQLGDLPPSAVTTHREIHPRHTRCPGKLFKV